MNKLFTKIAALALGATMAVGVGVAVASSGKEASQVSAATIGTNLVQVTSITSGNQYVITGANNTYALPTKPTVSSGKIVGTAIASVPADGTGFLWTITKSGNYYLIGDGSKYIYHSNGGASGTNIAYGTSQASYPWNLTYSATGQAHWTFKGVVASSSTIGSRGMLYQKGTVNKFGGYAVSNESSTDYGYMNIYEVASTKALSSIALSGSYQTTFTVGDTFNHTGMVVTATYSDSSTSNVTNSATWSSPNMSTAGTKTVTVSYTEGGTTKSTTYDIQVNEPRSVASLDVYDSDVNPLSDGDEVTLTASSGNTISTDVMCEVTYSPSGSDGNVTITSATGSGFNVTTTDHSVYTLTFSANGDHEITFAATEDPDNFAITVTYKVSGLPNITYLTDTIDNALTGVGDVTTYGSWSGKQDQSDAVYAGQSAGQHTTVQLRSKNSDSGVITTTTAGGVVTTIKATFNSNTATTRQVDFYGKNTAYSSPTDLYNASLQGTLIGSVTYDGSEVEYTIDVSSDSSKQFAYVAFRSNDSALYLDSVEITWAIEQEIIDTLESIEIDGSLTTSTYYEGQTISLDGLTVYGNYTNAGQVSLMGKTGLSFAANPSTATSTSLTQITVNASYEDKSDSQTYPVTVNADVVTALSWGTRGYENGDYFLAGKTLSECINTSKWTFTPTWASGISKPDPSFGTGTDDVHVGLYNNPAPQSETAEPLTNNYVFSTSDDGLYLVAFYKGIHSGSNRQLFITESLNSIVKPAEGDPGYFLVKDISNLSAGDTVVIASLNYDYAMSSTQSSNNRAGVEITKDASDSSITISSGVQLFTLEEGTTTDTWSFNTGDGYIYAASSSSNHLKTETNKSGNSSFTLTISNTGSAGLVANGSNTHKTMSWNNSNTLFSCYSSLQSNGQLAIYKYTEPMDEPINNLNLKVQHVVVEYAKSFNTSLEGICIAYGSTDVDDLENAWSTLSTNFSNWFDGSTKSLTDDEKTFAKDLFANAEAVDKEKVPTADSLQHMLAKYDWIVGHYEVSDFLKTDAGRNSAPIVRNNPISILGNKADVNVIAIVVITSVISLTAIGGYFFLRKRREQN